MTVSYALVPSRLGAAAVVARGGKLIASYLPGPVRDQMEDKIRRRFPGARRVAPSRVPGTAALADFLRSGDASGLARVPVELGGTPPFARRVYVALRKVPPGRTVTYGDLARRAGSPKAARAVGAAMARNPLAPFVPCHRVVGHDGGLTGFSAPGGTGLKRRLLRGEARAVANP